MFELFYSVEAINQLRDELRNRKVVLFADKEAARAALSSGASKNEVALLLRGTTYLFGRGFYPPELTRLIYRPEINSYLLEQGDKKI